MAEDAVLNDWPYSLSKMGQVSFLVLCVEGCVERPEELGRL